MTHSLSNPKAHKVSQGRCVHEGCKSSDAYTTYSDGSTYCFSCTRYESAKTGEYKGMQYMGPPKESVNSELRPYKHRQEVDLYNCKELYLHLRQYLEDAEIDKYFFYAPTFQRYVFAHAEDTDEAFYEARGTANRVPKSHIEGHRPEKLIIGDPKKTGIVVVVEDLISAIKVGRYYAAVPLFGSFMSKNQQAAISHIPNLKMVVMWLDADKYSLGMKYAKEMGMLCHSVAVHTDKDPKAYGQDPIRYVVDHALEEMEALSEQNAS